MPAPNPIRTTGQVLEAAGERIYRTELPNGKVIIAHIRPRLAASLGPLPIPSRVHLEMTSYDFSTGRISGLVQE